MLSVIQVKKSWFRASHEQKDILLNADDEEFYFSNVLLKVTCVEIKKK